MCEQRGGLPPDWPPKIPNYIDIIMKRLNFLNQSNDLNCYCSICLYKMFTSKKIFLKDFGPFLTPDLRGQPLFLGTGRKVLKFQKTFVQQVFRNSKPFLSYLEK